jgi:hypothetical protein
MYTPPGTLTLSISPSTLVVVFLTTQIAARHFS